MWAGRWMEETWCTWGSWRTGEDQSLLVASGSGGENKDNPVAWVEVEPWADFPSHVTVMVLSHGSKCQGSRISSSRVSGWPVKSQGVVDTHRVCLPGWNVPYHPPGISHCFSLATLQAQERRCHCSSSCQAGSTERGKHPSWPPSACVSINQVDLCSSPVKYGH